jgi:hypothetical protein
MAQAATRASAKRSRGSGKAQAQSRGPSTKSRQARSRGSYPKSGNSPAGSARPSSSSSTRGNSRSSARRTVGDRAKGAGQAVGNAASKSKMPILAGGAALVGAAGGLALGARQARRHHGIGWRIARRPQMKVDSRDLAKAAKEVGSFGTQMGKLAAELQQAREAANGGQHRSPIEVVLDGLTARRSR